MPGWWLVVVCLWLGLSSVVSGDASAQAKPARASLSLFDYDREAPLEVRENSRATTETYEIVDFTYESPDGGRVPALLYAPKGDGPFAGLIVMHGMPGSREKL